MGKLIQIFIALDQLFNTFIDGGYADETISARCWRLRNEQKWGKLKDKIDYIFLKFFNQQNHCLNSYLSEIERRQLPLEYRPLPSENI